MQRMLDTLQGRKGGNDGMTAKINGRTPEEIKRSYMMYRLRTANVWDEHCAGSMTLKGRVETAKWAYAYIQQLERERDAAVEAMFLKPLSWDEAMGDDAFLEIKDDEFIDAALNLFAYGTIDGSLKDGFIFYKTHDVDELKLLEIDYGKTWRCWARRPTDEERTAAVWEAE
jgi:hypothetical protein